MDHSDNKRNDFRYVKSLFDGDNIIFLFRIVFDDEVDGVQQ